VVSCGACCTLCEGTNTNFAHHVACACVLRCLSTRGSGLQRANDAGAYASPAAGSQPAVAAPPTAEESLPFDEDPQMWSFTTPPRMPTDATPLISLGRRGLPRKSEIGPPPTGTTVLVNCQSGQELWLSAITHDMKKQITWKVQVQSSYEVDFLEGPPTAYPSIIMKSFESTQS
jgi:hypothetical protein